ncbi:MAG: hypothetical protein AAFQ37_01960 [Bacteroidota bacterium]
MKKIHLGLVAVMLLIFSACEEKERAFPEFGDDNVQTGAFARLIDGVNGVFDFFDPAGSEIDFTVEFYDVNEGNDVAEYNWTVQHIDNANGNDSEAVPILNIPSSSFGRSDFGLPSTTVRFTLQEALDVLGLTTNDINGGDNMRFEATIVLNDGRTFSRANTGSNVISGASFRGTFLVDQAIICPSDLSGTYAVTSTTTLPWPYTCEGGTWTGETTWTEVAEGIYEVEDFSFGAYYACAGLTSGEGTSTLPGGSLQIQDACNILTPIGASRWGEVYTYEELSVDGPDLRIVWSNDYGEAATTIISRTDGTDWPPLTN